MSSIFFAAAVLTKCMTKPEWTVWKVWRIAPDCSWAAMTRGDGKVAFYNSKTREKYSAFVTYEVDPSGELRS